MDGNQSLRKFSPSAKRFIMSLSPGRKRSVKIMMRVSSGLDTQRQQQLEALGCQIRSVAGDIVTAEVPEEVLLQAGGLDFVSYIDVSQPLYPEIKTGQEITEEVENGTN